jgi:hypothetical protein
MLQYMKSSYRVFFSTCNESHFGFDPNFRLLLSVLTVCYKNEKFHAVYKKNKFKILNMGYATVRTMCTVSVERLATCVPCVQLLQ